MNKARASRTARVFLGAAALAALIASTAATSAETLKFLIPWTPAQESNKLSADHVIEAVKKMSGGEIQAQLFGPSVVPSFQQLQPVSSGAFDLHYTSPAYHAGATQVGMMMDAVARDQGKRRSSGVWDLVDKHYTTKHNLKVLGVAGSTSYQFVLKNPVGPDGGLKGMKIRSTPAYEPLIAHLGGISTQLPPAQMYTSLQKGLVDGVAFPVHSIVSLKLNEVAKNLVRPTFGTSTNLLVMNYDKWKKLSAKHQQVMLEVGKSFEQALYDIPKRVADRDEKTMLSTGSQIVNLGAQFSKDIHRIFAEGLWERGLKLQGADVKPIVDQVKAKGIMYAGE